MARKHVALGVMLGMLAALCLAMAAAAQGGGQGVGQTGTDDPCGPAPECQCTMRDPAEHMQCVVACSQKREKWNQCVAEQYLYRLQTRVAATLPGRTLVPPPAFTPVRPAGLPPYFAQAQAAPVGRDLQEALVVGFSGGVRVLRQGVEVALEEGARIAAGDEIVTEPGAWLFVVSPAGDEMEVMGDSRLRLEELGLEEVEIELDLGTILNRVREQPGREYRIRTPVAETGVRGTEFEVTTDGRTTTVRVLEGEVEVRDLAGEVVATLQAGERQTFAGEGQGASVPALLGGGVALLALAGLGAWYAVRRRGTAGATGCQGGEDA